VSGAQRDGRFHTNCVQYFLKAGYSDSLVVAFLVPANYLLANAQTVRQFGLRDAFSDSQLHYEGRDFVEAIDFGKLQITGVLRKNSSSAAGPHS